MVLITVTGDHDRPEWLITINGIRIGRMEGIAGESDDGTGRITAMSVIARQSG